MIGSLHFRNFKSLRDVELTGLGQLTVIVGPSGVGKTSILQGLELLGEVLNPDGARLDEGRFAIPRLKTVGSHERLELIVRGQEPDGRPVSLGLQLEDRESLRLGEPDGDGFSLPLANRPPPEDILGLYAFKQGRRGAFARGDVKKYGQLHPLGRHLRGATLLQFAPERLGAPSVSDPDPHLGTDGSGLATMLAYLAGADRDTLELIEAQLRGVIGLTGRIRTFPTELEIEERENIRIGEELVPRAIRRRTSAHRFEVEIDELGSVAGDLLSEGTLVTLGLLAALHQPRGPKLLLLDDIDRGLHPDAQARMLTTLRQLLASRPDLQLMCTSHSPYFLDQVEPEEVQVMSFAAGEVHAARLDCHADWPRWRGKLQTGEFWQSTGEDWVSKQVAADGE